MILETLVGSTLLQPTSLVYSLPPAEISAELLYFLYTELEFSNLLPVFLEVWLYIILV
jgi:hypothetical protein